MSARPLLELPSPPPGVPRRSIRRDDRFGGLEALGVEHAPVGRLVKPRLVSSAHGPIGHIMLWYPAGTEAAPEFRAIYTDLLSKLPETTEITLVAHPDSVADAEAIANEHARGDVKLVTTDPWLNFSVWAEDACVVVTDVGVEPPVKYLLEPFEFSRYGDQSVIDIVAQSSQAIQATQVPLIFQGGNVLIGDEFVLIGRDYLDESIRVAARRQTPIEGFPRAGTSEEQDSFIRALFSARLDTERDIHFLESTPRDRPENHLVERDGVRWVNVVDGGRGERQPIFHIDMFVSLAGRGGDGRYRILVGDPEAADRLMSWEPEEHELQGEYDEIAAQLQALDFDVRRVPLPVVPQVIRDPRTIEVGGQSVEVAGDMVWYHATSNNCLVQIDGGEQDVWLPTYGHGDAAGLAVVDEAHATTWADLGFTVHALGNFHPLAQMQGALHCIKKYLDR